MAYRLWSVANQKQQEPIPWLLSNPQDRFIAGALPLFEKACAHPPDQRMKPEDGLDAHVECGSQVVPAPNVAHLVRYNGAKLGFREMADYLPRQQQYRLSNSDNAGLDRLRCRQNRYRTTSDVEWCCRTPRCSDAGKSGHP